MCPRARHELMKVHRLIHRRQIVMEQCAIGMFQQNPRVVGGRSVKRIRLRTPQRQGFQERPRMLQPLHGILKPPRMIQHHVTHQSSNMPRRMRVVADERDPVARQAPLRNLQNLFPHFRRGPPINAVRQNVIELAERLIDLQQVHAQQLDVLQPKIVNHPLSPRQRLSRQIHTRELRIRKRHRHADDVGRFASSQLQHSAGLDRRGSEPRQFRQHPQPARMSLQNRKVVVAKLVVRVLRLRAQLPRPPGGGGGPGAAGLGNSFCGKLIQLLSAAGSFGSIVICSSAQ